MLTAIVALALRRRGVVVALAAVLMGAGIYSAIHAKYDVYPEFAPPQVVVQTEAPGLSPQDVEQLVTRPIESALNGTPNLVSIRSESIQGLSVATAIFTDRTDIYRARQLVSERLTEAAQTLPQGVQAPTMEPLIGATSLTLIIGLTSETLSPMDLRTFADWTMRPRLLGVPGVARLGIFGGQVRQLQVQAIPGRLAAFHLSLANVVAAARNSTGIRGAGFIETPSQRVVVQAHGQALTPAQLGQTVVASYNGRPVLLSELAHLADAGEPRIGDATIMGKPGILILISAQYRANTVEVTTAIGKALDDLKPALANAHVRLYPDLFRPANFIAAAIHNIGMSLAIGACLVAIVLMLFLMNMRVAVISLTAIPLSLLTSIILLDATGQSLNTLTLGGLAIAIGEVVDDAIIDAENIFRR
ncbi:MAG: efflux RND transporter permease subunit, partial [Bryobacteraceae bacterium]